MQAVIRVFNVIEIAQYGIARLMLMVDQSVIPGMQSITIKTKDMPWG
jgi:hypothetical protein